MSSSLCTPSVNISFFCNARSAGVQPAAVRWEFAGKPTFDNQIASLQLTGRGAHLTIEKTRPQDWSTPRLHQTLSRTIA